MNTQFANPSLDEIRALLKRVKTIAVVGLSSSPGRPSHGVAGALQNFGYRIIPINPLIDRALGEQAYPDLRSVPEAGIHLSRDALHADRRGVHLGALASCRLLTGADALKPAGTPALPGSNCPALK